MDTIAREGGKPIREKFLIFGAPRIEKKEIDEVVETLKSGWIGTGPKTHKFESMFKNYIGSKHALALNSCTAALHLSLLAGGIKSGDEVITTPMTFTATAATIIHCGAKPVFVDIEKDSMNIDPEKISERINSKTKVILPVHFAGRPVNVDKIANIAEQNNLLVVEDAAHALEASYKGKKIGTTADMSCFSFYVTKNLTTAEGGMVTTNNKKYADKIKIYGLHGMSKDAWARYSDKGYRHYQVVFPGYKYNMTDIQASLGIPQLNCVEDYLKIRENIWKHYTKEFKGLPLTTPTEPEEGVKHSRHLYTILLNLEELKSDRDAIMDALYYENIGTGVHYIALHLHPYYKKIFGYNLDDFPNAKYISDRTLSLPLSAKLTDEDVGHVVTAVKKVLEYYSK